MVRKTWSFLPIQMYHFPQVSHVQQSEARPSLCFEDFTASLHRHDCLSHCSLVVNPTSAISRPLSPQESQEGRKRGEGFNLITGLDLCATSSILRYSPKATLFIKQKTTLWLSSFKFKVLGAVCQEK